MNTSDSSSSQVTQAIHALEWLTQKDLSQIVETLANSNDKEILGKARLEVRAILDGINIAIVRAFMYRQEFMGLIAASKKEWDSILQLEREWEVIKNAGNIAIEAWEDEKYTEMLVWMITAAAKEKQRKILGRDTVFVKEILTQEESRNNLLVLTEIVAEKYDQYWKDFSATKLTREEEIRGIEKAAESVKNKWVAIDLGTANGSIVRKLAEQGFEKVYWYDVSPDMIRVANQLKTRTSETYTEVDLSTGIPMAEASVDFLVSSFGSAGEVHLDIIHEVNRVLKPGGKAWLSFYNTDAFAHIWWQPQQTSLEVIYNPIAQILEVPVYDTNAGKMKVFKIHALSKNITDIESEIRGTWLLIDQVESFPLLATMMPPVFFEDKRNELVAIEHDRAHGKIRPYRGYYLNVLLQKPENKVI